MMKIKIIISKAVVTAFFLGTISLVTAAYAKTGIINSQSSDKIYSYLKVSKTDVAHYKHIFRSIEAGDFNAADKETKKLDNDILLGHILAEKYLSKGYNSSFTELQSWLEKYVDHPQVGSIYRLAVSKRKGAEINCSYTPPKPRSVYAWMDTDLGSLTSSQKTFVTQKVRIFIQAMNQGKTKVARGVLENKDFRRMVPNKHLDSMAATLANKYLLDNSDSLAYTWASAASKRSNDASASWIAGLSAWRLKDYKKSAYYFGRLAKSGNSDEWLVSAGAYWAYRADSRLKQKDNALRWLKMASKYKRTFYGILANYQLGQNIDYNWTALSYLNDFTQDDYIDEILNSGALQRALLLLHAKQPDLAEKELRYNFKNMNDKQKEVTLFIAGQYKMHALGVIFSNQMKDEDRNIAYDVIAYPIPSFSPKGGWKVDKALLLALTRQESAFSPRAKSGAGACGLMQLMPNTAYHITKDKSLKKNTEPLMQADYNMALGQQYVNYLLEKPFINGNLFYLMTSYNGGPGNLLKWQKKARYEDDPLLFIEVIPARETRIYIERVMANMWIYQSRFGQELSGIKALSKNEWPMLKAAD